MKPENRNVSRETFERMGGTEQISLGSDSYCNADHKALAIRYNIHECPNCGRVTKGQTRLGDYSEDSV